MKYLIIPGVVYSGETPEQAWERERLMQEHNARDDERMRLESIAKMKPMKSMIEWAKQRGITL